MKKLFFIIAASAFCATAFGGGLLTNTNQNVRFLRNPARGASTEIDAVFSNPAGLAFMEHNGFTLSLNNQSAFQTRTITSTFPPFAMNGGSETKEYKGTTTAWFIPSLQAAYKWDRVVVSGSFAIVGGGGSLKFDKGLPSFEALVVNELKTPLSILNGAATQAVYTGAPLGYSLNMNLNGSSIIYGAQLGFTYKFNDMFSAFVGGRASIVNNSYNGYLRDVSITNADAVKTHFTNTAAYLESIGQTAAAAQMQMAAVGVTQLEQGASATDIALDSKQSGMGIAPILGVDFNYKKLNLGIKYDFNTNISIKNKTAKDDTGMFPDGDKDNYDIPALLSVGVSYKFFADKLTASLCFHLFFDKDADMTEGRQKNLNNNTYEWLAGLEYKINNKFLISAGGQISRSGLTDKFQSDMNFSLNSGSIGFGGEYNITDKLTLNLAYLFTIYDKYTNQKTSYEGIEVYNRTNKAFGIGIDYKF
jgi:long-chain fatty acid transport protein